MFGGNKSAEAPEEEETEETSVSGCSIVVQNRLQEQFGVDKKSYKKYIKLYIAAILKHLKETKPDEVDKFKANAPKAVDRILKAFDEWKFYHGETDFDFDNKDEAEGMLAIMGWKDDNPYMLFFKDGVIEEKAVRFHVLVTVYLLSGRIIVVAVLRKKPLQSTLLVNRQVQKSDGSTRSASPGRIDLDRLIS